MKNQITKLFINTVIKEVANMGLNGNDKEKLLSNKLFSNPTAMKNFIEVEWILIHKTI